jgi:hypothetical protein
LVDCDRAYNLRTRAGRAAQHARRRPTHARARPPAPPAPEPPQPAATMASSWPRVQVCLQVVAVVLLSSIATLVRYGEKTNAPRLGASVCGGCARCVGGPRARALCRRASVAREAAGPTTACPHAAVAGRSPTRCPAWRRCAGPGGAKTGAGRRRAPAGRPDLALSGRRGSAPARAHAPPAGARAALAARPRWAEPYPTAVDPHPHAPTLQRCSQSC